MAEPARDGGSPKVRSRGPNPASGIGHSARSDPLRPAIPPADRIGQLQDAVADIKHDLRMLKVTVDKQTQLLQRLADHRESGD